MLPWLTLAERRATREEFLGRPPFHPDETYQERLFYYLRNWKATLWLRRETEAAFAGMRVVDDGSHLTAEAVPESDVTDFMYNSRAIEAAYSSISDYEAGRIFERAARLTKARS
jgi:hypothetical protein